MAERRRPSVLVIDRDASSVDALRALLELDGFDVTAVTSSRRALDLLDVRRFDAVVTDLDMPRSRSLEIIAAAQRETPVFVVTAGATGPPPRELAVRHVFDKPLDYDALATALREVTSQPETKA
jgi:DNA-binding NtrC family response regulator